MNYIRRAVRMDWLICGVLELLHSGMSEDSTERTNAMCEA